MANQRFNKKSQQSTWAKIAESKIDDITQRINAIDFIEGPGGTGLVLRPVQRVIVKAMCGVPFDYRPKWADAIAGWGMVPMWNVYRDELIRTVSEEEYIRIIHDEGRCNLRDWRDIPERGFNEGVFMVGRRGGKSELVAALAAYRLYMLLSIQCPQEFFGMAEGSQIDFTFLAQDETGAGRLFKKLSAAVNRATWFAPYLKDNNNKQLTFLCEADRHLPTPKPSVIVNSLPCTSSAVRGPSSIFLALDEFAHFRSEVGSTSEDMYVAATPAAADFHHNETIDGEEVQFQDSMILSISSPLKRVGMMYELYKMALEDGINEDNPTLALCCSSAEMNPHLKPGFLRDKARKKPLTFKAEYGGQFLESSESYVREVDVRACVEENRFNTVRFDPQHVGRQYFWALDLGGINVTNPDNATSDPTALAIGHLEFRQRETTEKINHGITLVYDFIDRMMAGEKFDGVGVTPSLPGEPSKYSDYQVLPVNDLLLWLKTMNTILPCFKGVVDQHAGRQLITLLEMNDIKGVELVNLTPAINSEMAYALRGFINDKTALFPNVPKFIHEIKMVETDIVSKYRIRVRAPLERGAHDDLVDAVQMVSLLAQKWLIEQGHLRLDPSGQSLLIQQTMFKPAAPVTSLEGLSMTELKLRERLRRTGGGTGLPGTGLPGGNRSDPRWVRRMGGRRLR